MTTLNKNTFAKAQRIANRCREVKGWKGGSIFARSENRDVGNLYIYAIIGSSWFEEGVTAESVRSALDALKGVKTLNVFINSEGGDVFEAKAIYTQLKRFNAEVVVYIDGIAASAATFIAMAGNKIITSPAATWMVHEAWTIAMGNAGDLRDSADLLEMMNEDIALIYSERTGRTVEAMRALMAGETWMNAQQALTEKFTDEVATFESEDDTEEAASNKATSKIFSAAETTRSRIASMTAELMQFKAKRSLAEHKEKEQNQQNNTRASAATRKPASR